MTPLSVTNLDTVGKGLRRPEDVAIRRNGQVFASDGNATVSEVLADGTLRPVGPPANEPNGINFTSDGTALIVADFSANQLQRCDLVTGAVTVVCVEVEGRALTRPNYPIVMPDGTIYCTASTASDLMDCIVFGIPDGFVFRVLPDGSAELLVDDMLLPNGLALDADRSHLYVVRTAAGDVVRFPILADGRLGALQPYGPPLGDRTEFGDEGADFAWGDNPIRDYTTLNPMLQPKWALPDGCAFDVEGNLWVALTGRNAIVAITPDGDVRTVLDASEPRLVRPANVSFGGPDMRDVYFGSAEGADYLLYGRSSVAGLEMPGQAANWGRT